MSEDDYLCARGWTRYGDQWARLRGNVLIIRSQSDAIQAQVAEDKACFAFAVARD